MAVLAVLLALRVGVGQPTSRETVSFNFGWRFELGDPPGTAPICNDTRCVCHLTWSRIPPSISATVRSRSRSSELKERTFSGMSKARHVDFFDNNDCCRPSILIFLVHPFPFLPLPSPSPLPSSAFDINATQGCSNMVFAPLKSPFDCFKACCPGSGYHPDCRVWQYAETQWLPNRRWKQTNPLSNQ